MPNVLYKGFLTKSVDSDQTPQNAGLLDKGLMVLFMFHNSQITLLSSQSTQQSSYITIHNTILRTSQFQDGRSNEMGTSIM